MSDIDEEMMNAIKLLKVESNKLQEQRNKLQEQRDKDQMRFIVTSLITFFGPLLCAVVAAWAGAKWGAAEAKADIQEDIDVAIERAETAEAEVCRVQRVTADMHARMETLDVAELRAVVATLRQEQDDLMEAMARAEKPRPEEHGIVTGPGPSWTPEDLRRFVEGREFLPWEMFPSPPDSLAVCPE